jgi:hypothetical protein
MVKKSKKVDEQPRSITFTVVDEENRPVEMIRVSSDGFFFKGEKVEDKEKIYDRMCQWLAVAEEISNLELKRNQLLAASLKDIMAKYPEYAPKDDPIVS